MRGHEPLLKLRRRHGKAPGAVWVSVGGDAMGAWRDWPLWTGAAHVEIEPADSVQLLDLRCMVGLLVFVDGQDVARVEAVHHACAAAGAKRVISHAMRIVGRGEGRRFETCAEWISPAYEEAAA